MRQAKVFTAQKYCCTGMGLPLLLVFIGAYYILKSLGYIKEIVPSWAIIAVAVGLYMLIKRVIAYYSK